MTTREELAELVDEIRGEWWQRWEDANGGPGSLTYDIEQGWDEAWACVEDRLLPLIDLA